MRVVVVNCGSTTLKHSVIRVGATGSVEDEGNPETTPLPPGGVGPVLLDLVAQIRPDAVGHRVVHGGPDHRAPEVVTTALIDDLHAVVPLAPLHLPAAIEAMAAVVTHTHVVSVACFDTAFHATMPESATRFPLQDRWYDEGIRRYGFHGLACQSVVEQLGAALPRRLVIGHLGGGASVTAVLEGRSVRTSMGLTPTGGIPGATRPGDLDPGVVLALVRRLGDVDVAERELTTASGLDGWGGHHGDIRTLESRRDEGDERAAFALNAFAEEIARAIAAHAVTLGGLDLVAFSGGAGENDRRLVDDVTARVASVVPGVAMTRIAVREDHVIARATASLLGPGGVSTR